MKTESFEELNIFLLYLRDVSSRTPRPNEIIIYFVEHFIGVWHQNGFFNNFHLFYVYNWINGLPGCQPSAHFDRGWVGLTDFSEKKLFSIFSATPW